MTLQDPVTGEELDSRFQMQVVGGPSWERLCDGLKYQRPTDHVEIAFTWLLHDGGERRVSGRVTAINGDPKNPSTNPSVKFVPEYDCSTYPTPLEISYWPTRREGHTTNVELQQLYK